MPFIIASYDTHLPLYPCIPSNRPPPPGGASRGGAKPSQARRQPFLHGHPCPLPLIKQTINYRVPKPPGIPAHHEGPRDPGAKLTTLHVTSDRLSRPPSYSVGIKTAKIDSPLSRSSRPVKPYHVYNYAGLALKQVSAPMLSPTTPTLGNGCGRSGSGPWPLAAVAADPQKIVQCLVIALCIGLAIVVVKGPMTLV